MFSGERKIPTGGLTFPVKNEAGENEAGDFIEPTEQQ